MSTPVVQLRKLSVGYSTLGRVRSVLRGLDLVLSAGDWLMLRGENGSGKSTLIKAMLSEIPPSDGSIEWEIDGGKSAVYVLKQDPLETCPATLTVGEALWVSDQTPPASKRAAMKKYQALLGANGLNISTRAATHTLSGGERQIVGLLMGMSRSVRLLILDEPTAALDRANEARCLEIIRSLATPSTAILHVTHNTEHFRNCGNRHYELRDGSLHSVKP